MIAQEPTNGEAWYSLGMVQFGQNQFAGAEECFRRAGEIHPDDAQVWNNRGVCLWKLNRIADARACFQKALTNDPTDADAQFNLKSIG